MVVATSCGGSDAGDDGAESIGESTIVDDGSIDAAAAVDGAADSIDIVRSPDLDAWCLGWADDLFDQDDESPEAVQGAMEAMERADENLFAVAPDEIADAMAWSLIKTREFVEAHRQADWDSDAGFASAIENQKPGDEGTSIFVDDLLSEFAEERCDS